MSSYRPEAHVSPMGAGGAAFKYTPPSGCRVFDHISIYFKTWKYLVPVGFLVLPSFCLWY